MGIPLFLVVFILNMTVRVAVIIAILRAERVECICEAVEYAFGCFLGAGAGNGEDGNVVFVFEAAV